MDPIQYIGETTWPSHLGKFLIILGFVTAALAALSYAFATNKRKTSEASSWTSIGRFAFGIHGLSIISVIGLIFFVMVNQMYEYQYVQAHVSDDLPMRYIFSAFWEGQEGSFLLWMFWHIVLGTIILFKKGKWEAPVLSLVSLLQLVLTSMILGLYINFGDSEFRLGSNPILLLRDVIDAPIFANADYVSLIQGTGLNELLQNYWMTIHPPTLFLGFASAAIPFCFAVAGMWVKEYKDWLRPSLNWALFAGFALGTGVLMGAAWAYEALTFGGYWAWDPVENMSLVPWLILIAGIHTHLVSKATGYSIKTTILFYILSFILVLYSTFLTRSGVLGDTSAHSFTEMGLEWQLVGLITLFLAIGIYFLARSWRKIPSPEKEERMSTREFWMFIGSLVLFFSGLLITSSTSLPVYNKIISYFKPEHIGYVINDPVEHYNKYQLWIGLFVSLLSGIAILLRYYEKNWEVRKKKYITILGGSLALALIFHYIFTLFIDVVAWQYHLLSISAFFVVFTNLYYLVKIISFNLKTSGSVLAHSGFGLMLLGIMASGLSKEYISSNPFAQQGLLDEELLNTSVILVKDKPIFMNNYWLEYESDTLEDKLRYFNINFKKADENNNIIDEFTLRPTAQLSNDLSKVAAFNPDTRHYLSYDVFTDVRSLPRAQMNIEAAKEMEDSIKYISYAMNVGNMIDSTEYSIELLNIKPSGTHLKDSETKGELSVHFDFKVSDKLADTSYIISPYLYLDGLLVYSTFEDVPPLGLRIRVNEAFFDDYFAQDELLPYKDYVFKENESKVIGDYSVTLSGFNRNVNHPNYQEETGDIAIAANLDFRSLTDDQNAEESFRLSPVYIIRGNRPFSIKDHYYKDRLHARLKNIDPQSGSFVIAIAQEEQSFNSVPVEIANNVPRSDIIVLEAILFPGINLVWLGSVMMMIGLLVGLISRSRSKNV